LEKHLKGSRRSLLAVGLGAASGLIMAESAHAQGLARRDARPSNGPLLDRLAVADLVTRERAARDAGDWATMAASYADDSVVEVSWFRGSGAKFVAASEKNLSATRLSQHLLAPTTASVVGERAIAETPCQLLGFATIAGADVCVFGFARLVWRAVKLKEDWKIAGLRMIYIRDFLLPCSPNHVLNVEGAQFAQFRLSYRYLSYVLSQSDHPARDDLPGIDRPELVSALRNAERAWLANA
jgi:hypothetical protein